MPLQMEVILKNYTPPTSKIAEVICQLCSEKCSKYRCPRCGFASCSIDCSKKHKARYACSGLRDRTKFIPLSDFDDGKLHSDIGFLEDALRVKEVAQKSFHDFDPLKRKGMLVDEAYKRRIDLRLLPEWSPKHKQNRTFVNKNKMFWTVHFIIKDILNDGEKSTIDVIRHRCMEHCRIDELWKSISVCNQLQISQQTRDQLKDCFAKFTLDFTFSLRLESACSRRNSPTVVLDSTKKLKECLMGKIVVEYPTIIVTCQPKLSNLEIEEGEIDAADSIPT